MCATLGFATSVKSNGACCGTPADLPAGVELSAEEAVVAMDEYRKHAEWMFMRLRTDRNAPSSPGG
jgi:hypothetical protein